MNVLMWLISFFVFAVLQAIFINGVKASMEEGMILFKFSKFFEKIIKSEYWRKPFISCIKCMSSVYGAITFWPTVTLVYGWHWEEIPIFIADVFILIILNWWIYKRM